MNVNSTILQIIYWLIDWSSLIMSYTYLIAYVTMEPNIVIRSIDCALKKNLRSTQTNHVTPPKIWVAVGFSLECYLFGLLPSVFFEPAPIIYSLTANFIIFHSSYAIWNVFTSQFDLVLAWCDCLISYLVVLSLDC